MPIPSPQCLSDDARAIFAAALGAVEPGALLVRRPLAEWLGARAESFNAIRLVAFGKASLPLAVAVERALDAAGARLAGGVAIVPHGYLADWRTKGAPLPAGIEIREAGHPKPDAEGLAAARRVLELAEASGEGDLLLALISGGGSALCPAFAEGITLDDARATFQLLLASGAAIDEVNIVRRHLSRVGGGRLAAAAWPAATRALLLSDVPGDDPETIASGPASPDPTSFADAWGILETHELIERLPGSVLAHLRRGCKDPSMETPKPGAPELARAEAFLLGNNRLAREAAAAEAERLGYAAVFAGQPLEGEARDAAPALIRETLAAAERERRPVCLVAGGETTVTVRGGGKGGRNQELALAAALELERHACPAALLAAGTDGIDGPTDAAGGLACDATAAAIRAAGHDPAAALADNDAYPALKSAGALLQTGPTHTNVMDLVLVLVAPGEMNCTTPPKVASSI